MRGREIRKLVCLFLYFTILLTSVNTYCQSFKSLWPFPAPKTKGGASKTLVFTAKWYLWYSCQDYIPNPNKPTAAYNSRRSCVWVQLYNHNHDYHHLFRNSQFMKFINSLKHLFSSYYVWGTMSPAGPTKMNKDLNSKFCFQKQMSCSRSWTKKWGQLHTQYNGYYSKTKAQKITSVSEDIDILEPLCIASKNVKWSSCYTKQFGGSSKN